MKKIVFAILVLTLSANCVFAQYGYGRARNLVHADNKLYHFGFILGLNSMDFNLSHSGVVVEDGKIWFRSAERRGVK